MRNLLGRLRRPISRSQLTRATTLISDGDGSTLSLDFTAMSGLDSRFTFTRASTATFINSSGLVKYADHNLYYNTGFSGLSGGNPSLTSSGWQYALSTGGTATFNGDGSVTVAATSTRRAISRSAGFAAGSRRVIVSVDITSSGDTGLTPSQLLREGTFSNESYYINSAVWTSGNVVGPCTLSFVYDSGTGNANPYFGVGTASNSTGTVTFANPRVGFFNGVVPAPYFANTSTTAERHDARFDHDPTTLAPRGLLIEGSATNLATYSADFSNVIWMVDNGSATNPSVSVVSQTAPDGGASVNRITFNKTGGTFSRIRQTLTGTASATYTLSVWLKANTASGGAATQNVGLRIGADPAGFNCVVTTTWKRFSYSYALSGTDASAQIMLWDNIIGNDETADVLVWGAQLEAGSGASSYIPTGASTVQRAADSCSMTGTNFSSWYPAGTTSGTFFYQFDNSRSNLGLTPNPTPIALGEYSAGNLIAGLMNTTAVGSGATITIWGSGGSGFQQSAIGATISQGNKLAFAFNGQTATGSLNGGSGTATTTGTVNAKTILFIGGSGSGSSLVRDYINAPIQRIKFFPSVFSTAQLQSLTQ